MGHGLPNVKWIARAVIAAVCGAALIWLWPSTASRPDVPLVRDDAGLMTGEQHEAGTRYHQHLLNDFDIDYRVATARRLDDINRTAVEMFRAFGEASHSRTSRALLLLIDAASDQVRLEVGYPLVLRLEDGYVHGGAPCIRGGCVVVEPSGQ
jgi:uncharacterized membrane protein YgcG